MTRGSTDLAELLGRPQVKSRPARNLANLTGKRVLVTGAGGSIGSELVAQIAACGPSAIILFELCEFNLYRVEHALRASGYTGEIQPLLGDVRHAWVVETVFYEHKPQQVFHAAALKHVPLLETQHNLIEAVRTNVLGTKNIADNSMRYHAEQMVLISTDKAVHPQSMMGLTKRWAEGYCQELATHVDDDTRYSVVRFGNVLGSSGSVVPLFQQQIAAGGPVTVTHPDMERYFMTVSEAVSLVLQASQLSMVSGLKCPTFMLDMGKPVKIVDVAEQMIRMMGYEPGVDIKIEFVGMRPGEKLREELSEPDEVTFLTSNPRITGLVPHHGPGYRDGALRLEDATQHRDYKKTVKILSSLGFHLQPSAA